MCARHLLGAARSHRPVRSGVLRARRVLGHRSVKTTMIHTHALIRGRRGVRGADRLDLL